MKFRLWLETKLGVGKPLYHANPNVEELQKKGFTKENLDLLGSGISSVAVGGGRAPYGSSGIHLSRSLDFCIRFAKKLGPEGGVVEVIFNTRKPFYIPESVTTKGNTNFKVFVNPEEKYLLPLTGDKKIDIDRIALAIGNMKTTKEAYEKGSYGIQHSIDSKAPLSLQAKALATELISGGKGFTKHGWGHDFREINPAFEENPFTILNWTNWKEWADKGYLDSVWWGSGGGPFHGEDEVTVFDPRRLRVGAIVHTNKPSDPVARAKKRW